MKLSAAGVFWGPMAIDMVRDNRLGAVALDVFPNGARCPLANLRFSELAPLLASKFADEGPLLNQLDE